MTALESTETTPYLSVIIPVYNRERLVLRALHSVLQDPATDIEVIVIDDGSTDATVANVQSISDPRLRLMQLQVNGGRCPARNKGVAQARGEWLVFLDSDDELIPGSLNEIRERAKSAGPRVGKILFSCRDDTGTVSPSPALDNRVVDYAGYLRFHEESSPSEALPCTRRSAFLQAPYPDERYAWEGIHELDFAKLYDVQLCKAIVRLYHYDAPVRVMTPTAEHSKRSSAGEAKYVHAVLTRHGEALRIHAPERHRIFTREAALYAFLAGDRLAGIRSSVNAIRLAPLNVKSWIVLAVGMAGSGPLRHVWSMRRARFSA